MDLKSKDKKNPTEADVAAGKAGLGSGHDALKGAYYDGFGNNINTPFLGGGKFNAGGGGSAMPSPFERKQDATGPAAPEDPKI